jgi:hypothetical protein
VLNHDHVAINMIDLPAELWNAIFDLAADEDVIFDHRLQTVMSESYWAKSSAEWQLRTSQDSLDLVQTRSYATKKVRMCVCYSVLI